MSWKAWSLTRSWRRPTRSNGVSGSTWSWPDLWRGSTWGNGMGWSAGSWPNFWRRSTWRDRMSGHTWTFREIATGIGQCSLDDDGYARHDFWFLFFGG